MSTGLCECGCGLPTNIARKSDTKRGYIRGCPRRFLVGHRARTKPCASYRKMWDRANHELRCTHVVIAEAALGKRLPKHAEVHHVDGNKLNNARSNLVICQDVAYHRLLDARTAVIKVGGNPNTQRVCRRCKQPKDFSAFHRSVKVQHSGRQSACRDCQRLWTSRNSVLAQVAS